MKDDKVETRKIIETLALGAILGLGCVLIGCSSLVDAGGVPGSYSASGVGTTTALTCDGRWQTLPAVDPGIRYGDFNSLNAVAGLSPADVWAVGDFHRFAEEPVHIHSLIEHWDGSSWTVVPTPNTALPNALLFGVAVIAHDDVWAVGYEEDYLTGYRTLIEHWNGTEWSTVQDGTYQGWLTSITAVSPDNVWAVGSTDYIGNGLIEHWDGKTWRETLLPDGVFLRAVLAMNRGDIWAVGQLSHDYFGDYTFAAHFDGGAWTQVPTPSPLNERPEDQNWLTSLTATSSTDVWATGITRDPDWGIRDRTFTAHWDGSKWSVVRTSNPGGDSRNNQLWGSAAWSPNNVWAVGSTGGTDSRANSQMLAEVWNGRTWTAVPSGVVEGGATDGWGGGILALARVPPAQLETVPEAPEIMQNSALFATGNRIAGDHTGTLVAYACR